MSKIGEEITLPGAEKTGNHESDEQSVPDEQSVEIMLEKLTEANFLKYFFVAVSKPDQNRGENQRGTTGKFLR